MTVDLSGILVGDERPVIVDGVNSSLILVGGEGSTSVLVGKVDSTAIVGRSSSSVKPVVMLVVTIDSSSV